MPTSGGAVRVRSRRKSAGLTQAQLAAQVEVSRQTIVAIERGDYSPGVYLALRIARRLDTTVESLFPLEPIAEAPGLGEQQ